MDTSNVYSQSLEQESQAQSQICSWGNLDPLELDLTCQSLLKFYHHNDVCWHDYIRSTQPCNPGGSNTGKTDSESCFNKLNQVRLNE